MKQIGVLIVLMTAMVITVWAQEREVDKRLVKAAMEQDVAGMKAALQDGAFIDCMAKGMLTPFMICASNGSIEGIKFLKEQGADINKVNRGRWNALHLAAKRGRTEMVKALIGMGMDVNARDIDLATPLYHAIDAGCEDTALLLLGYKPEMDYVVLYFAMCPLKLAVQNKLPLVVARMLSLGANPHLQDTAVFTKTSGSAEMAALFADRS